MVNLIAECVYLHTHSEIEYKQHQIKRENKMNRTTEDRRSRKTKHIIRETLLQLLKEKRLTQITISELADTADINRKSFYNHYESIYAVLDELEDECIERMLTLFSEDSIKNYINNPTTFFLRLAKELKNNEEFYKILIDSEENLKLIQKLTDRLRKYFCQSEQLLGYTQSPYFEYFINFIVSGMASVYNSWFQTEKKISIEELSVFIGNLINNPISFFLQNNSINDGTI